MAVTALQLHVRPIRRASNRSHMQHMVQPDRSGIAICLVRSFELRMAVVQAANPGKNICFAALRMQIRMAIGAPLI